MTNLPFSIKTNYRVVRVQSFPRARALYKKSVIIYSGIKATVMGSLAKASVDK